MANKIDLLNYTAQAHLKKQCYIVFAQSRVLKRFHNDFPPFQYTSLHVKSTECYKINIKEKNVDYVSVKD